MTRLFAAPQGFVRFVCERVLDPAEGRGPLHQRLDPAPVRLFAEEGPPLRRLLSETGGAERFPERHPATVPQHEAGVIAGIRGVVGVVAAPQGELGDGAQGADDPDANQEMPAVLVQDGRA